MKPPFVRYLLLLTALVALGEGRACADMIDFGYSWKAAPTVISGGTGVVALAVEKPEKP